MARGARIDNSAFLQGAPGIRDQRLEAPHLRNRDPPPELRQRKGAPLALVVGRIGRGLDLLDQSSTSHVTEPAVQVRRQHALPRAVSFLDDLDDRIAMCGPLGENEQYPQLERVKRKKVIRVLASADVAAVRRRVRILCRRGAADREAAANAGAASCLFAPVTAVGHLHCEAGPPPPPGRRCRKSRSVIGACRCWPALSRCGRPAALRKRDARPIHEKMEQIVE